MSKTYDMEIAGCKRSLPICPIDEKLDIAGFVMFSDVEITERTAAELLKNDTVRRLVIDSCSFRFISYLGNVFSGVQ